MSSTQVFFRASSRHARRTSWFTALLAAVFAPLAACQSGTSSDGGIWIPEVVARYPHDTNAYTQGLLVHEGKLYESTGLEGRSSLRRVRIETGGIEQRHDLDDVYFGEGLALVGDRLYQITWLNETAFVYDVDSFRQTASFEYDGEGWGLTYDGEQLIMSNGTATLKFIDPVDFSVKRTVTVTDNGRSQTSLNELEYIDGEVWANIYYDDRVARIDPDDGRVIGWIDLGGLYPASARPTDSVVNGIAWDEDNDRIFVTGKLWPLIFEIRFDER